MHKFYLILCLLVLKLGSLQAQHHEIGLTLYPSKMLDLSEDIEDVETKNVITLSFGANYEYKFNKHWGIETGLLYWRRNIEAKFYDPAFDPVTFNVKYKDSHLSLPVKLGYYYGDKYQPFVKAGAMVSTIIYRKVTENSVEREYGTTAGAELYGVLDAGLAMNINEQWKGLVSASYSVDILGFAYNSIDYPFVGLNLGFRRVF